METDRPSNPLETQVGGDHYKNFKIQPIEYSMKNNLNFIQGDIVKRITRYNALGGEGRQDLEKIKHEIDLLILLEYSDTVKRTTEWAEKIYPVKNPGTWEDQDYTITYAGDGWMIDKDDSKNS